MATILEALNSISVYLGSEQARIDAQRKLVINIMEIQQDLYKKGYSHHDSAKIIIEGMDLGFRVNDPNFTNDSYSAEERKMILKLHPTFFDKEELIIPVDLTEMYKEEIGLRERLTNKRSRQNAD